MPKAQARCQGFATQAKAVANTLLMKLHDPLRQVLERLIQWNRRRRLQHRLLIGGIGEHLRLQWTPLGGAGPVNDSWSLLLTHVAQVVPFIETMAGLGRWLLTHWPRATPRRGALNLGSGTLPTLFG